MRTWSPLYEVPLTMQTKVAELHARRHPGAPVAQWRMNAYGRRPVDFRMSGEAGDGR